MLIGGGGGLPSVTGDSFTVKILPVTAGSVSGYTAQEIMELFQNLDPEAVAQAGAAHIAAASKLTDLANAVTTHVTKLQATWGGEAAQSAVDAFSKLQSSATGLANAAQQTGTVLSTLGNDVLPQYQTWSTVVPASGDGLTATQSQQLQTDANYAAQQKLAELNDVLVSANSALPNTVKVNLPTLGKTAGTASLPGVSAGPGSGAVVVLTSTGSRTGVGSGITSSGNPPGVTSPAPRTGTPATPTTPAPIQLSSVPQPGTSPSPVTPGTGVTPGTPGTGTPAPGPGSNVPGTGPSPVVPPGTTPLSTSGSTSPKPGGPADDDSTIPGTDESVPPGDLPGVPNSVIPGTTPFGSVPPADDNPSPNGFTSPAPGDGVVPGEDPFGVMPGDTAVIGPDGMIGVPGGSPMGGFGAFSDDPGASGLVGGDAAGPFAGGGIADGNVAAGSATGADAVDGAGGYGGFPMGGGAGNNNNEKERYRESWMNEDEDLWNGGVPMVPSLIGR